MSDIIRRVKQAQILAGEDAVISSLQYKGSHLPVDPDGFTPVGRVKTVGGYPDESEHEVEWLVEHKVLSDGDFLYSKLYETAKPTEAEQYQSLANVLEDAYAQAASGKGHDRHGCGLSFEEQPMQKLIDLYGLGFALGQAGKKMQEAQRMDVDAAKRELLGAINYIAGAVIHLGKPNG